MAASVAIVCGIGWSYDNRRIILPSSTYHSSKYHIQTHISTRWSGSPARISPSLPPPAAPQRSTAQICSAGLEWKVAAICPIPIRRINCWGLCPVERAVSWASRGGLWGVVRWWSILVHSPYRISLSCREECQRWTRRARGGRCGRSGRSGRTALPAPWRGSVESVRICRRRRSSRSWWRRSRLFLRCGRCCAGKTQNTLSWQPTCLNRTIFRRWRACPACSPAKLAINPHSHTRTLSSKWGCRRTIRLLLLCWRCGIS